MDTVLSVIGGLLTAYILLVLTPWGQRLRFWAVQRAGDPGLVIHVESDPANVPRVGVDDATRTMFASQFFLPGEALSPQGVPAPPDEGSAQWWRWAHEMGAVDSGCAAVLVTVQSLQEGAVVIDPPVVHHTCIAVPVGADLSPEGLGSGGVVPREYRVELDGPSVGIRYVDGLDRAPAFTLADNESERLLISVVGRGDWLYEWRLELPVIANGSRRTLRIDNNGEPFVLAGMSDERRGLMWHGGAWRES